MQHGAGAPVILTPALHTPFTTGQKTCGSDNDLHALDGVRRPVVLTKSIPMYHGVRRPVVLTKSIPMYHGVRRPVVLTKPIPM